MNSKTIFWPQVRQIPVLPREQVHVWAWDLDIAPLSSDWAILSEDETLRARRFVFPRDRDHYVRAHSKVRELLGAYTGVRRAELAFFNNAYGKPQIQCAQNEECVRFNLTHSHGMAALAISRGYEVGVDLEVVRPIEPEVAAHHFSEQELRTLESLPPEAWLAGFYRCWTSKEALLKGEGLGLNLALNAFDVEVDPERSPALLAARPPAQLQPGWLLFDLKPALHTLGTLAVRDEAGRFTVEAIRCFACPGW